VYFDMCIPPCNERVPVRNATAIAIAAGITFRYALEADPDATVARNAGSEADRKPFAPAPQR